MAISKQKEGGITKTISLSPHEKGDVFERHVKDWLISDPVQRKEFSQVWRWGEWANNQGVSAQDTGIDLVAQKKNGDLCAIQCKFYHPDHQLTKANIDSFFAASGKSYKGAKFSDRLIVSTTDNWSAHANDTLENQQIPCRRLDFWEHHEIIRHLEDSGKIEYQRRKAGKKKLRPHQQEAVKDVMEGFATTDRGKLIMACGTGKTLTSLKIAEQLISKKRNQKGLVLFLVPSLALLSQTLREWVEQADLSLSPVAVCSDTKAADEDIYQYDLEIPPTTNSDRLAKEIAFFQQAKEKGMMVIFSTYHSIDVVARAQQATGAAFDLIICDEAHRTTGVDSPNREKSYFVRVHDKDYLKATKRLYMTATPRIYKESDKEKAKEQDIEAFSMDDSAQYGEEFHRLNFSAAVEQDLLSDYRVIILVVNEHGLANMQTELNLDDTAKIIGCWNGLAKRFKLGDEDLSAKQFGFEDGDLSAKPTYDPKPMKRAVAFASRIKDSVQITDHFNQLVEQYQQNHPEDNPLECEIEHLDGSQSMLKRNGDLRWLREDPGPNSCRILSNVRCLSEGVDVPALDAVIFFQPRRSQVDIVQSVGRVMRKAEGKKYGYIILPIAASPGQDPEEALNKHPSYKVVWGVLQALRSHDDRFNIEINKIDLNQGRCDRIQVVGVGTGAEEDVVDRVREDIAVQLPLELDAWRNAILAQVVKKCGDRLYWENWTKDVAQIAQRSTKRIQARVDELHRKGDDSFTEFHRGLRRNINPSISEEDAIDMLSQHLITQPVFNALFEGYDFAKQNPVSISMQKMIDRLREADIQAETQGLEEFYRSVANRAAGIDNMEGKQRVINELYEKFFGTAFPRMAERLGIVYTPTEVIDFILHSADWLLKKEFGRSLSGDNIHILDPFTGTGAFINRLLQSSLIRPTDLERKYDKELHANEILLLAYYIAAVTIEQSFHYCQLQQDSSFGFKPFEGIVLTDTFQLSEGEDMVSSQFPTNSERAIKQKNTPIQVIIGNPPYSAGQTSANDNNANLSYTQLDETIRSSYATHSMTGKKASLYDSYIRAIRWASDRIDDKGIVAFVTNGGYIDGNAMDGLRKCLMEDFTSIYCFNLRGNTRLSGDKVRREGGKIFGSGSRATIAISFLVRNPKASSHQLYYYDIGDYLTREEKLQKINEFGSAAKIPWQKISPDQHNDWINQRKPFFAKFLPLGAKANKKKPGSVDTVFNQYGLGVSTNRDSWAYNFSYSALENNMTRMIEFYNQQLELYQRNKQQDEKKALVLVSRDKTKIKWDGTIWQDMVRGKKGTFSLNSIRPAFYRPFVQKHLYFDRQFNSSIHLHPRFFPQPPPPSTKPSVLLA